MKSPTVLERAAAEIAWSFGDNPECGEEVAFEFILPALVHMVVSGWTIAPPASSRTTRTVSRARAREDRQ